MSGMALAKRYAKGLFEAAKAEGRCEQLARDARLLSAAFAALPELRRALADERVGLARRLDAASAVCGALGLARESLAAVLLMVKGGGSLLISAAAEQAGRLVERSLGVERVSLRIADIDDAEAEIVTKGVERALGEATSKTIVCDIVRDSSLIGGFEVRIGDMRIDASVAGMLSRMRASLGSTAESI